MPGKNRVVVYVWDKLRPEPLLIGYLPVKIYNVPF